MAARFRRLAHQTRHLISVRGEMRGLWQDSASAHVDQRYLRPHEQKAGSYVESLEQSERACEQVETSVEQCASHGEVARQHDDAARSQVADADLDIRTSYDHTSLANQMNGEAGRIAASALGIAEAAGHCCDGCADRSGTPGSATTIAYVGTFEGLSAIGSRSIADYTADDYTQMNRRLDGGTLLEVESDKARLGGLIEALRSAGNEFQGTVYRGTQLSDDALAKYQEGATVIENRFTSTSTDRSIANGFLNNANGGAGGNAFFEITSTSGRQIAGLSTYSPESEVLLNYSSRLQVTSVTTGSNGVTLIRATQL